MECLKHKHTQHTKCITWLQRYNWCQHHMDPIISRRAMLPRLWYGILFHMANENTPAVWGPFPIPVRLPRSKVVGLGWFWVAATVGLASVSMGDDVIPLRSVVSIFAPVIVVRNSDSDVIDMRPSWYEVLLNEEGIIVLLGYSSMLTVVVESLLFDWYKGI